MASDGLGQPSLSPSAREFLCWAADDFSEAFVLRDVLRRLEGSLSSEIERLKALEVINELFDADLLVVGDMRSGAAGLQLWSGTTKDVRGRLEKEWRIEDPPRMGEGPWFDATEKGKMLARALREGHV